MSAARAARAVLLFLGTLVVWTVAPLAVGWNAHVVLTGSMEPLVRPGDVVVSAPLHERSDNAELLGRVVVFPDPAAPGRTLTHRVVATSGADAVVTKGDGNASADSSPVPVSTMIGAARLRIPAVGSAVVWWHSRRYAPLTACATALAVLSTTALSRPDEPRAPDGQVS